MGDTNQQNIINKINANLILLNSIQNQLNTRNNLIQESLIKKELLLKMENEDLINQLKDLETIQNTISNKNRIIDQNNKYDEQQNINIKVLITGFIISIFFIVILILYGLNILNYNILKISFIILMIIYFLLLIYANNMFYFREALDYTGFFRKGALLKHLEKIDKNSQELNKIILGDQNKDTWENNNCDCPSDSKSSISDVNMNYVPPELPGYFYYDGTAPQQLLMPTPKKSESLILNSKIEWPDYSPNGNSKINNKDNTIITENNKFYNYKSTTDPSVLLLKELSKSNVLENSVTYTTDL
jgi:hypothetical protein